MTPKQLLVKGTSIREDQVDALFALSDADGYPLSNSFKDKNYTNPEEVLADLCRKMGLDFIKDIPFNDIPADLVLNIPINYAKSHEILPYKEDTYSVTVLSTNPLNVKDQDDMKVLFGKRISPLFTTSKHIQEAINRVYEKSTATLDGLDEIDSEEYDLEDQVIDLLESGDDDAPVIKLVNTLLFRAVKEKASDIH
ncbi:MAG: type II secretion system protein GspE, partial [Bdellovibrionales bacterium]|nr:type II secretion system protein GspE [Bdellovibrionales bacterium]